MNAKALVTRRRSFRAGELTVVAVYSRRFDVFFATGSIWTAVSERLRTGRVSDGELSISAGAVRDGAPGPPSTVSSATLASPTARLRPARRSPCVIFVSALAMLNCENSALADSSAPPVNGGATASSYSGFLDTYNGLGPTWGFSTCKLERSFSGDFGVVIRQSDGARRTIGFGSNGCADVATFTSFCAETNCSWTTLVDQLNGNNATCANVRGYVGSNGFLSVAPGPGGVCTVPYSEKYSTPKQEIIAVAKAGYLDSRWSQGDLPTVRIKANVVRQSETITSMSSQAGVSLVSPDVNLGPRTGVYDSAGYVSSDAYLSTFPSATSATLGWGDGEQSPTGTRNGDTLTITNAVSNGPFVMQGPASSNYSTSAYWGFGFAPGGYASDISTPLNGNVGYQSSTQNIFGEGMRRLLGVYDFDSYGRELFFNSHDIATAPGVPNKNISYPTNAKLSLFADAAGQETAQNNAFQMIVLASSPARPAVRAAFYGTLAKQLNLIDLPALQTSDGFAMAAQYQPNGVPEASRYGVGPVIGPDAWGMSWNPQSGGYSWPSIAYATNITNSASFYRFIVRQGDSDVNITAAERSEINVANAQVAPGQSWSEFYQFKFEQLPDQNGNWCVFGQVHYNDVYSGAPDLLAASCANKHIQFVTQNASGTSKCGSARALNVGTTYAVVVTGSWSTNHKSDTLKVWFGANGGALPVVCDKSSTALWDNDTGAYMKAGIYRGYAWNNAGVAVLDVFNPQFSATANAYASYIIGQPALPKH